MAILCWAAKNSFRGTSMYSLYTALKEGIIRQSTELNPVCHGLKLNYMFINVVQYTVCVLYKSTMHKERPYLRSGS
jgi:hypothetical protein